MSTNVERDYEAERLEQERLWEQRRAEGGVNTISPHSGYIDWRTVPGLMERLQTSLHPADPFIASWFDELVKRERGETHE